MPLLPLWSTLFLTWIGPIASQTGSSFFYYYSPNQPMQINSQTFGSNAQSHQQLLPANENSNPFNLQNHFRGNSNSNSPQGGTGGGGGGFHREVTPIPYVTTSPFIPRRQPHAIQNNQNQQYQQQQQPQQNYESSLLDKITFANAPPTQPSPPELNSYYNQQQQSGISTPPTTSFPGQPQPSAKLFNFLNQPFQFFQNSYNRFAQNNQQQQQLNDAQTPPQRQPIIPQEVRNSHIPQQINEQNQQYFYNYYSRPNQQGSAYHQGTANNKEQRYISQSPGVDYAVPPPAVKDRSRQQSFLVNQYFSTKTTQGPPTSYTFTIGADPTSGPTATVRVNVGGPDDALPPPPKLSFPNHQRLIPIRQYESSVINEEDVSLPEAPESDQNENQVNSQLAPESPPSAYPPQESSQPEAPPQIPELIEESDDYEEAEPLTTTGKPVIMVITNRRTTTEDSQTIIATATSTTPPSPSSSTSRPTTPEPTEPSTTTTTTPAFSSTTTMSTTSTTEMPSPSTTTTTTTQAPPTTTTSLGTSTTTTTTTPKPPAIKQRKVIRKKVARKRLPGRGKNSRVVTPSPPPTPAVEEEEVQEEYRVPSAPRPGEEQELAKPEEISPITTQSPGRRRTTTSERPFRITTRKQRLRITTTPLTTTTTTSTTVAPEELEVATTTEAAAPPPREVYTTSPPRRHYTTTQSPERVNYSTAPPTNAPEEEVEGATIAPVFSTTTEEFIPRTYNSRQPEPEFTSSTGKSVASLAEEEDEEDSPSSSSTTTTEPYRIYNEEISRSRTRTTEAPYFIEGDIDDDTVAVGTTASTLEGTTPTASTTSTEPAIIYTTSRSRSTSTFSPTEGSSTESTTVSHSNGGPNDSPDVNYPEYDEYYEYDETPGHTEASSTSSPTTTSSSTTPSTTETYKGRGEFRQRATTTTSPETFPTTVFSRRRSSTTSDESLIEDGEYARTESPSSSTTRTTSGYKDEADSSGVPSSTEATTEPILLSEDEIIEPLSTTEAPVSSSTQSDVSDVSSSEESADDLNGINSSSSSTTVSPTLASTTEKSESTTLRESELVSSTEDSSSRSGKAIESQVSQDPLSEEAPAVVDYKDGGVIGKAGDRDFYETPVRELDEVSPTGPSSTSEAPSQFNYDDFPGQEEYNYPEEREEFDPYEDEKIEEAKKLSLKAALQNIRSRQNATSTTEKPLNETSTEKKFLRRPVPVRTFSSSSNSASSSAGNTYDDEELGEDSRSQVIQKIQSFRQKLRKVTTTVVRASTTKRPRRVTRPSNKSTSTENPGDLSQNENDIRGNGKDELDNEVSRHPKVISDKKKNAEEFKEEGEKKEKEISSEAVVSLPGGEEEKGLGSVKDTIRNDGNDDSQNEPKPNLLEFEEVSSSTTTTSMTTTTTTTTSTTSPISSDEPSSTVKNAVTHVGELIIHEILPTTSTTSSTTEETPQDQKDVDFDTGSAETGQTFEHSTSISVAISSEFEDEDEPSSSTTVAPTTSTTTSTTTALPITTKRPKGRFVRVRGKQVNAATTTAVTSTTTEATPIITTAPTTTEATTAAAASSTELLTSSSSSTTEESLPTLVATEISFQTNVSNLETSSESSSSGSGRKVKVILKRRKGAPKGGKVTVTRQVVRTRSRSKPKVTEAA